MLLPIALLLIHPQVATTISLTAERATIVFPAAISAPIRSADAEALLPASLASPDAAAPPVAAADPNTALPEAPAPVSVAAAPAPMAFLNPNKRMKVSVSELIAENRRKQLMWKGLTIASSGAATFDAWSTRHAISTGGAQELNPLLRPFAGNASLYAAIQVGPVLMDFAGKKMMYSRHSWVRHMWWIPQSASFASSIFCGAHNLAFH
jgi:hypothetical protein